MALQAAAVAPDLTAVWDTSSRKTWVGTIGGRTCEQQPTIMRILSALLEHGALPATLIGQDKACQSRIQMRKCKWRS